MHRALCGAAWELISKRTPAMPKDMSSSALDTLNELEEPLVDTTAAIPLHSKRTERRQKKRHLKEKASKQHATLWDLPSELVTNILTLLRPSDLFRFSRVNQPLREFVLQEEASLCRKIVAKRYAVLSQCFPLPVLLENVDGEIRPAMLSDERQAVMNIHKRPYQHIHPPDQHLICTCLTCMLAWNNLNLVVDFSHWQRNLDQGEPIPMVARGKNPSWNRKLIVANAEVVKKALRSTLWYARILEGHLKATVGSIHRHGNNKGNKRRRFQMSMEDVKAETDFFLERSGPPSLDFPFHRDNYYMLEAYLPNRGWNAEFSEWRYMPASQHYRDIEFVKSWAKRKEAAARKEAEQRAETMEERPLAP
ncbi:hypothetical protein BKA65DRAFT_481342 [Rhexocercosporidium sp. MPI-PUGE-AT-0058]|nr:hypothetical protein BKA65DRAFT_481342 [Rhexocercosporidium sp. MPI-PUGE-AT-0058]